MKERSFLDTNILIYTDDADAPDKQTCASRLVSAGWKSGNAVISTQVLQEYFSAATRKLSVPVDIARRKVDLYRHLHTVLIDPDDVLRAIDLHRLHGFSIWDALIVNAAQSGGCRVLYSEDMQHGREVDGLKIINPFIAED